MYFFLVIVSAKRYSPAAHIPAAHNNNNDVMQKKLIDCPISSQEPWGTMSWVISRSSRAYQYLWRWRRKPMSSLEVTIRRIQKYEMWTHRLSELERRAAGRTVGDGGSRSAGRMPRRGWYRARLFWISKTYGELGMKIAVEKVRCIPAMPPWRRG